MDHYLRVYHLPEPEEFHQVDLSEMKNYGLGYMINDVWKYEIGRFDYLWVN